MVMLRRVMPLEQQPDFFLLLELCGCILDATTGAYRHTCEACHMAEIEGEIDAVLMRPGRKVERVTLGECGRRVLG